MINRSIPIPQQNLITHLHLYLSTVSPAQNGLLSLILAPYFQSTNGVGTPSKIATHPKRVPSHPYPNASTRYGAKSGKLNEQSERKNVVAAKAEAEYDV
jgi:hypothetical protein